VMFGVQSFPGPGIDLTAVGAAGSRAYQNGDLGAFVFMVSGGQGSHLTFVPFEPTLFGTTLFVQTIGFTSQNSLSMAPSNGLAARLGW
jgi:predicted P-loop ATPase